MDVLFDIVIWALSTWEGRFIIITYIAVAIVVFKMFD